MKKINEDIVKALENCAEALSLNELSRRTGIGIRQLQRFLTKRTNLIREETWDKIYPVLKPYLSVPESEEPVRPPRLGAPARRHHDLVDLLSDQKILLDIFAALTPEEQQLLFRNWEQLAGTPGEPTALGSLSPAENRLLGLFAALPAERQEPELLALAERATAELRRQRAEMF